MSSRCQVDDGKVKRLAQAVPQWQNNGRGTGSARASAAVTLGPSSGDAMAIYREWKDQG